MKRIIALLALFSFMLWWGGFTFYAAFVIPTGQQVLGSHILVGFITQQVAPVINSIALITCLLCFIAEWLFAGSIRAVKKHAYVFTIIMLGGLITLYTLYPQMQTLLNNQTHTITNEPHFYLLHRIYLLTCTAMWLNAVVYIILKIKNTSTP